MPFQETTADTSPASPEPARSLFTSMLRGWRKKCPACGKGALLSGYLKVPQNCSNCGEELHHHRADDAPPYFTIFLVGHLVVPTALLLEMTMRPPLWLQALLWGPLTVLLALYFLPHFKGALIGLQWAFRMHGFGDEANNNAIDISD